MFKYEKRNLIMKLPNMIKFMAKASEVTIEESTIEAILNQIKYYMNNFTTNFPLDKNTPWVVDIKPISNDIYDKYGIAVMNEYTVNLTLFRNKSKEYHNIHRELIFLASDGKLLAIYHYRPVKVNTKLFHDEFNKKIYTVPQKIIEEIKGHIGD